MTVNQDFLNAPTFTYRSFCVQRVLLLKELNATLREIKHTPSGAQIMHIDCDDSENLFSLSFRTYPSSSNGAAHILEHTVLCGSKKFPVKDPFFAMNRRSLNTFMNALTGSDFTCYPAASQNEKDFYNLLDVYLDAVFHPELKKMSFLQEGHRLEFTDPKNAQTPLQIKGIVFNEMKGALASPEARLWHSLMEDLLPDLPYAYNSGGDPKVIPQLSYKQLLEFHQTFYHPSRCLFFFYGNFSLKKHLDTLEDTLLNQVTKAPPLDPIPLQKRFKKSLKKELSYPIDPSEESKKRSFVAFAFLTAPLIDQEAVLALSLLDIILMDTDASLLKAELLKTGLCAHVDAYIDIEMSEVPYAIIFRGCDESDADAIEHALRKALHNMITTNIPQDAIDSALHQLELARLEIATDHAPFGLTLFMRSALAKQHGCPPENALMIYSLFESLLKKLEDPHYLTGLIQTYFLDNPHQVRLVMRPDPELSSQENAHEKEMLSQLRSKLSSNEVQSILEETAQLKEFQLETEEQSLDCLPKVTLADVSPLIRKIPLSHSKEGNLEVYHCDQFTNHMTYADFFFDLPHLPAEDLPYVNLLLSLIPEVGCGGRTYEENLRSIQTHTGGIGLSCHLYNQIEDPSQTKPAIHMRGKALDRNAPHLLSLMHQMLKGARFDEKKRMQELIHKRREALLSQLNRKALRYATHLCFSGASNSAYIQECWRGLTYFKLIETLSKNTSSDVNKLVDKLYTLKEQLFTFHNPVFVLTCSESTKTQALDKKAQGLCELIALDHHDLWKGDYLLPDVSSQFRPLSSHVAFTVEGFRVPHYLSPHSPALTVATALLEKLILHRQIREQGGAYGAGAQYHPNLGHFYFHTYRDPHIASSLQSFHQAIDAIALGKFTPQDLEEAKLAILQGVDTPISPGALGLTAYTRLREGKTETMRQHFRTTLLELNPSQVQDTIVECLASQKNQGVVVSFSGRELIEKEKDQLLSQDNLFPILPI